MTTEEGFKGEKLLGGGKRIRPAERNNAARHVDNASTSQIGRGWVGGYDDGSR